MIGAQLFATAECINTFRPVPDADRIVAAGVVFNTLFQSEDAGQYFETGNHKNYADSCISQHSLSKNGTEWIAREVQHELELSDALMPLQSPPSLDMKTLFDVQHCFPTILGQKVLDMVADNTSVDYPHTAYKKGDVLPIHPSFRAALPL